jgi:ATP-dependent RNA helicase DeaD
MLNMGFYEDIVNILSTTPDEKTHGYSRLQCLQVAGVNNSWKIIEITVETKNSVLQQFHMSFTLNARDRYEALKRLADANRSIFSVFCRTKREIHKLLLRN